MIIGVTGAAGRVGRHLIGELLKQNHKVKGMDITKNECNYNNFEFFDADITDYDRVFEIIKGCDTVIHLAALGAPGIKSDQETIRINTVGTFNILEACGQLGINRVVMASSDSAVGFAWAKHFKAPKYLPVDENHPNNGDDAYALSKLMCEETARTMVNRYDGMSVAALRITMITGPRKKDYEVIEHLFNIDEIKPDGQNLFSYVDIRDACDAFISAIDADIKGCEVMHITAADSRSNITTQELVEKNFNDAIINGKIDGYQTLQSNDKARTLLGYEPKHSWRNYLDVEK